MAAAETPAQPTQGCQAEVIAALSSVLLQPGPPATAKEEQHPPMGKRVVPPDVRVLLTRVPFTVTNPTSRLAAAAEAKSRSATAEGHPDSPVHSWQALSLYR